MCWAGLGSRLCLWDLAPRTGVDVRGVRAGAGVGAGEREPALSCSPWEAPAIEYSITFNSSTTLFFSQYVNSSHTMLISRIQKKTKQNKTKQNSVTKGTFQGNVKSFLFLVSRISRV